MNDKSAKDSQDKKRQLKTPPIRPTKSTSKSEEEFSRSIVKLRWNGKNCPIWQEKEKIISAISAHQIVVLTAPPATGKSTQLPLMMLEAEFLKVVLVVPTYRLAKELANIISSLLKGKGKKTTLLKDKSSEDDFVNNQVIVMTAKKAVRFNLVNKLGQREVLILDEIHQWSEEQEVLNGLVMQQINQRGFSCIVTSATLYSDSLVEYHNQYIGDQASIQLEVCKDVNTYDIQDVDYSDLVEFDPELTDRIKYFRNPFKKRDYLVLLAIDYCFSQEEDIDILIFFKAKKEIENWKKKLLKCNLPHKIYCIYGERGYEAIDKDVADTSSPKILLSTNILETGFNLKVSKKVDLGLAVIDLLEKYENYFNPETNVEELRSVKISKAEQKQRRGRTGRESNGIYIPIPSISPAKNEEFGAYIGKNVTPEKLLKYPIPALERQELSKMVLRLRDNGVNLEDIQLFHSPERENIAKAIENLQAIDYLNKRGEITPLGKIAVGIDLSPSAARIVIETMIRFPNSTDLHDEALLVACILDKRGIIDRHKKNQSFLPDSPKWVKLSREKGFKSDVIFQKYLLIDQLNALDEANNKKLEENAEKMQLSFRQIKKVITAYQNKRAMLSQWQEQLIKYNISSEDLKSSDEIVFNTNEECLRFCILIGFPMWFCFLSGLQVKNVLKGETFPSLIYLTPNYIPYDINFSSEECPLFEPDSRQCLLGYKTNAPKWIVANRIQHLEDSTFSLYTEIEPSWVEVLSKKLRKEKCLKTYTIFYHQNDYRWCCVNSFYNAVISIRVIDEKPKATVVEILTEGIRYMRTNVKGILNCNEEKISEYLKDILRIGNVKIGQLVEGVITDISYSSLKIESGGNSWTIRKRDIKGNVKLREHFTINDRIKAIVTTIGLGTKEATLSTKPLELYSGEILEYPSLVNKEAEKRAAEYRKQEGDTLIQKNRRRYNGLLIKYVICKLYQFVRHIKQQKNVRLETSDYELLTKLCTYCANELPQIISEEEIANKDFAQVAELLSNAIEELSRKAILSDG